MDQIPRVIRLCKNRGHSPVVVGEMEAIGGTVPADSAGMDDTARPVILRSSNGEDWVEATALPRSHGILTDITRGSNGRYAAVGTARDGRLIVWHSDDGLSWTEETLADQADGTVPFTGFDALAVAGGDRGFVVADGYRDEMWTSTDALEWTAIPGPPPAGETSFGPEYQLALEANRIVVLFSRQYSANPAEQATTWWVGQSERSE
jgi:hypothetical protein